jgi:hypothetical protein
MSSILRCGGIGKSVNPQLPIPGPAGSPYFSVVAAIWMGSEVQELTMKYERYRRSAGNWRWRTAAIE